jgi:hypothetical protein
MGGARVVICAFMSTIGEGAADEVGATLLLPLGTGLHARTAAILAALDKIIALPATHISRYKDGLKAFACRNSWTSFGKLAGWSGSLEAARDPTVASTTMAGVMPETSLARTHQTAQQEAANDRDP